MAPHLHLPELSMSLTEHRRLHCNYHFLLLSVLFLFLGMRMGSLSVSSAYGRSIRCVPHYGIGCRVIP